MISSSGAAYSPDTIAPIKEPKPMATMTHRRLDVPTEFHTSNAALVTASLDDQSLLLFRDLEGATPEELRWQPHPGMNTIGMLLAHMAIVEVWWTLIIVGKADPADVRPILGIADDADGMPIEPSAQPTASLDGKNLAFYRELHAKARAYFTKMAAGMSHDDLVAETVRKRDDGTEIGISGRWYLYHVLEHFSGHYGQILLLRHLYQDARSRS
jgi:uncharacterized damage-inducible protein DinB